MATTRDRYRAQVRDDVKAAALAQLAAGGPASVSLNAIAKGLGVSGPALYRYFAGRDALLTALVLDAYADLEAALRGAEAVPAAIADAYRAWVLAQPHRYRLLFAAPTPGYDAHRDELVAAAQRCMDVLADAMDEARPYTLRAAGFWARVHGLVSLEIEGNWASMGLDPEVLFRAEVAS